MCSGGGLAVSTPAYPHIRSMGCSRSLLATQQCRQSRRRRTRTTQRTGTRPMRTISSSRRMLGIVDVATWHALTAQEVLWEERQVGTDEHRPEVQLASPFRIHTARHFGQVESRSPQRSQRPHPSSSHSGSAPQHSRCRGSTGPQRPGQNDACHTTNGEQEQEAEGPKHRCFELDRAAPHGRDPARRP